MDSGPQIAVERKFPCATMPVAHHYARRGRDGRVAEGGGLLNRCTVKSRTGGSNPPLSAIPHQIAPRRSEFHVLAQSIVEEDADGHHGNYRRDEQTRDAKLCRALIV